MPVLSAGSVLVAIHLQVKCFIAPPRVGFFIALLALWAASLHLFIAAMESAFS